MSDEECIIGATNRAKAAFELKKEEADYGVGIEGGVSLIGDKWFECGWITVIDKNGKIGLGSSGRFEVSSKIMNELKQGKELGVLVDELSGKQNVRSNLGAMGLITNGHLPRDIAYTHGVFFAWAKFLSDKVYWE